MNTDQWYKIIDQDVSDPRALVEDLKSKWWKYYWIFLALVVVGMVIWATGGHPKRMMVGLFLALCGVLGKLSIGIMCHTQLCMYKLIIEMRKEKAQT